MKISHFVDIIQARDVHKNKINISRQLIKSNEISRNSEILLIARAPVSLRETVNLLIVKIKVDEIQTFGMQNIRKAFLENYPLQRKTIYYYEEKQARDRVDIAESPCTGDRYY